MAVSRSCSREGPTFTYVVSYDINIIYNTIHVFDGTVGSDRHDKYTGGVQMGLFIIFLRYMFLIRIKFDVFPWICNSSVPIESSS